MKPDQYAMLLKWIRTDGDNDYALGYTAGYIQACLHEMEPWQRQHLFNIQNQYRRGKTA